jgi:DNA repair exonuclease SbcCD ATPase subunit
MTNRGIDDGVARGSGRIIAVCAFMALTIAASPAMAQTSSVEDRLREALRRVTVDLRATQDNQAALQAALDQTRKERDVLQQRVNEIAAQPAPAPVAAPAAPSPQDLADAQHLRDVAKDLDKQNAALRDGLAHWQTAYQQAASLAREKDAQARQAAVTLATAQATLNVCQTKNTRLTTVANDILHLYQSPKFKSLVAGSWEPLLGYKQVELENVVQDHEDQIRDAHYFPGEQPPAPKATTAANNVTP